jgi:probable rRNA maturation factor
MTKIAIACQGVRRPDWIASCRRFCKLALARLGLKNREVSVLLCSDEIIRDLNARYRQQDRPTDVLSFSQTEGDGFPAIGGPEAVPIGDIAISLDSLAANSRLFGVSRDEELKRLLVHGLLHLAGRDHAGIGPDEPMLIEQEALLSQLEAEHIL